MNLKKNVEMANEIGSGTKISPEEAEKIFEMSEKAVEERRKAAEDAAKNRVNFEESKPYYDSETEEKMFKSFIEYLNSDLFKQLNEYLIRRERQS